MSATHPRSYQREELDTFAKKVPALQAWLAQDDTRAVLDQYDAAEVEAKASQLRYLAAARRATRFTTLGTALAALFIIPFDKIAGIEVPQWMGLVQLVCVLIGMASIWSINWFRLLPRWMEARAEAEELRAIMFRDLMQAEFPAGASGEPGLKAQLDTFLACHFNYQRDYYERRGGQLTKAANSVTPMTAAGYMFVVLSAAVSAIVAVHFIKFLGFTAPQVLQQAADHIPDPARLQLGLGALASAAFSFAAAWTLINQDDRNAARYAATLRKLDALRDNALAPAIAAAAEGRHEDVLTFTDRAQAILDAEHAAWVAARPPRNPHAGPGYKLRKAV